MLHATLYTLLHYIGIKEPINVHRIKAMNSKERGGVYVGASRSACSGGPNQVSLRNVSGVHHDKVNIHTHTEKKRIKKIYFALVCV
jgi:hypothetical protein